MRTLGGFALTVCAAVAAVTLGGLEFLPTVLDDRSRAVIFAVSSAGLSVVLTAIIVVLYQRARLARLVVAAERLAAGELETTVDSTGRGLEGRLGRAINAISSSILAKHDAATVDRLTGVASRQALLAALFTEVDRASRYGRPFTVAFVDIDHFKQVNDTYGHAAGDVVLRGVAQTIRANLRATDTVGRYGGEEFLLLLTETDVEDAATLAEKLRNLVGRLRFEVDGNSGLTVTVSIGIAGGVGQAVRTDQLVRDADAAMYSAKSLGRNQTYIFAEPSDDARVPRAPISPLGRARAQEIGAVARAAAERALTDVVAPLPRHRGQPSPVVVAIVAAMAGQLDLPNAEVDRLRVAALLLDIGKIAVPVEILEKPTALTSAEWRTLVQHPRIAQVILEQAAAMKDAIPLILHHHERYAGHGYPFGLRGNEIPLGARLLAIADAYEAMTRDRPYKRAVGHEQAVGEIRRHAGTQFDPELVKLFCDLFADAPPVPDAAVVATLDRTERPATASVRSLPSPRRRQTRATSARREELVEADSAAS